MTNTTAGTGGGPAITLEAIERAMVALAAMGPEPIGAWMAAQGFPPERGGRLLLPDSMRAELTLPAFLPWYVRFTSLLAAPCLAWHTWPGP